MASVMHDPALLNEKYALLCSEKCKLLNSIESVSRESKTIKMEICSILDLIAEFKTDKELEEIELDSDSEMTMDPFNVSFLNLSNSLKELDKIKKIKAEIMGSDQNAEKKPKRKLVKKPKLAEDPSISADQTENVLIEENDISVVNVQ